ncbi:MAG: hypothetical protein KF729_21695 [Sandaracinaceae bacterium]|nr:hypothetical protein [Sandaracinaceae bacterium]
MRPAVFALALLVPAVAGAQPLAILAPPPADPFLGESAPEGPEPFGAPIGLYDPSGQAMRAFHESLRRAEAGEDQARVVFYGASHVAADFFPQLVRQRLQERFGDAGHGFVMPVRPWRGYRHLGGPTVEWIRQWSGLRIRAGSRAVEPLGVAGMAVETTRPTAWGRLDTAGLRAGRFVVHYLRQPGGGTFELRVDGGRPLRVPTSADAMAPGLETIDGLADGPHVLEVRARGDGPVRLFGVSVEREHAGVIVDTMGLNGARASSQLLWQQDLHEPALRSLRPSLVVLAYGTNESGDDSPIERYEEELLRVVGRVRGVVPSASCLLIGPSDRPLRAGGELVERPRTREIIEVQRRVARALGCGFFDLVEFGGGPLSMVRWAASDPPFAQRDLVHFTVRAYQRLGEVLHDAIMAGFTPARDEERGAPMALSGSGSR